MAFINLKQRALPVLVAGACLISLSGVWVKLAHVPATVSAFYRVFFGFLFLLPVALIRKEIRPRPPKKYLLSVVCALFFAYDLYFWHISILYIGPGLATMLANFQVFGLALIGVLFFKEKLRFVFVLSIPLAIAGLYLIVGGGWQNLGPAYKTGVYYGFAAAACYIGFLMTLKRLQSDARDFSLFYYLMLVSFFTSLILGCHVAAEGVSFGIPDIQSLLALAALGLISQCVGWAMISNAIPHIRTSLTGLILLLQPSLSFVWDVVFFHRATSFINWIGVFLTLSAIYMGMVRSNGKQPRK